MTYPQNNMNDAMSLTNYSTSNPIIFLLTNSFIRKIGRLLKAIDTHHLFGLDAGCGEGHLLNYLYRRKVVDRMMALDIEQGKLDFARRHNAFCPYCIGNVQRLPFKNDVFDFILTTEVFEHLTNPGKALRELQRVSKPGGYLIISVPFEPFFHWGNVLRGKYWDRRGRTPDHNHFWNRHEFLFFLESCVQVLKYSCYSTFPWLLVLGRFR